MLHICEMLLMLTFINGIGDIVHKINVRNKKSRLINNYFTCL